MVGGYEGAGHTEGDRHTKEAETERVRKWGELSIRGCGAHEAGDVRRCRVESTGRDTEVQGTAGPEKYGRRKARMGGGLERRGRAQHDWGQYGGRRARMGGGHGGARHMEGQGYTKVEGPIPEPWSSYIKIWPLTSKTERWWGKGKIIYGKTVSRGVAPL